ncbi:MAG: hypothetical protein ACREQI_13540 [Candidatus Binataceae bacterium]
MAALSIYLGLSLLLLGLPLLGHFQTAALGMSKDASLFMWCLEWWPHAIAAGIDPFFTKSIWAPAGFTLAWSTVIPLPALLAWPITAAFGPVAAFNALALAAPALAAWTAFLLCRHLSKSWWSSLLGGYLFGFSAYVLSETSFGHPSLTLVFLVPIAALAAVRAIEGEIELRGLTAALAVIFIAQALISLEIFATMTVFGAIALALGWLCASRETAQRMTGVALAAARAEALAAIALSPYLYAMAAFGWPHGAIWSPAFYSADLLNFIVPTEANALGAIPLLRHLSDSFSSGGFAETTAYVSIPLIALAADYAIRHWRTPAGKVLIGTLLIVCAVALGPLLRLHGSERFALPGRIVWSIPIIDKALPVRFMMFAFLPLAVIASLWFASERLNTGVKAAVAGIAILFTAPNPFAPWVNGTGCPLFFTSGIYRRYLTPGENVLALPFAWRGISMLWQAETGMYFRMAGGWTGVAPAEFSGWPIFQIFLNAGYMPDAAEQLAAFMAAHDASAAIVDDHAPAAADWRRLFLELKAEPTEAGGVTVYRVPQSGLETYRAQSAAQMRAHAASAVIDSLLRAAGGWIGAGYHPAQLTPSAAVQRGLLKKSGCVGPAMDLQGFDRKAVSATSARFCGVLIGATPAGYVMLGTIGAYSALQPAIDRYRNIATRIYFPYPYVLPSSGGPFIPPSFQGTLVMEFDREQIARIMKQLGAAR